MPLPFDDRGLLPPGVHDATLEEIDAALGRFRKSTRRITLMANLRAYVEELRKTGWDFQLVIDGSFVMTAIDEPNDIDAILVLPADWDFLASLRPWLYNLLDKRATRRDHKFDVIAVANGSVAESEAFALFGGTRAHWCDLFGWDHSTTKGLIRIIP